jgi:hypothetical protein
MKSNDLLCFSDSNWHNERCTVYVDVIDLGQLPDPSPHCPSTSGHLVAALPHASPTALLVLGEPRRFKHRGSHKDAAPAASIASTSSPADVPRSFPLFVENFTITCCSLGAPDGFRSPSTTCNIYVYLSKSTAVGPLLSREMKQDIELMDLRGGLGLIDFQIERYDVHLLHHEGPPRFTSKWVTRKE